LKHPVKVLFASGSDDLIPTAIERMRAILPDLPLAVVSEFPPTEDVRWIPYHMRRTASENLALCRASLKDQDVRISAIILQPRMPYWPMRAVGFALSPWNFLAFNENLNHFMLRPRSLPTMLGHFRWRARNFLVWEFSPGGFIYTFLWRLAHPWAFKRPLQAIAARIAGRVAPRASTRTLPDAAPPLPRGITVVIPSRNGKDLLARGLPEIVRQIGGAGEVIVSDNGASDGTAEWLRFAYPGVKVVVSAQPLSFARAVNAGIDAAAYSHLCLLNNDMAIEPGFFAALLAPFDRVPDLFCSTAQIFFPAGVRREETGKAVMPPAGVLKKDDFPVTCDLPIPGEDHSYVLYGSGGCSLYDTAKLRRLGALDPVYQPAYVEDLDLGVRGWQQGWPTVFAAGARVLHEHRATTSRYYTPEQLDAILELNYLRFIARVETELASFRNLWSRAIDRLNLLAARQVPNRAALDALEQAWRIAFSPRTGHSGSLAHDAIYALGSGAVAVFPGRTAGGKPVVLIATPYIPFPLSHGGAVRMYNLMRRAAADFDQVLVSFVDELRPVPQEVLDICVEVVTVKRYGSHLRASSGRPDMVEEFDSPAFHAALRQTIRKWKPGVAQLEFTHMAQYAADCAPAKTLLVEHDVTLDLHQQLLSQGEDWELRHQLDRWIPFETAAWRQMSAVVTMSEKDRGMIAGARAVCLPNGVDIERFTPSDEEPEPGRLLFIGSFGHLPNLLAIEFFLREVWPHLKGATLHIIAGSRHQYFLDHYRDRVRVDLKQPGIEVEDFVADVRPAYRRAAIVIAPLLASAGTNIKVMEAMAMGKAIVSTPGGVNGLDLASGCDAIVTDASSAMADAIMALLQDPARRRAIEVQARATVVQRFNWDVIARQQKALYESLLT
jgi:GT2 family glycosyltransferase/glycosyltransferase involved in cell wall biosynthesis